MSNNNIAGYLKLELLLIKGSNRVDVNYIKDVYVYDYGGQCKPTGHRGCGKTFDADLLEEIPFIENTIESFDEAFRRGAKMVEFDVVLSKDKLPFIYHDFSLCARNEINPNKYFDIHVHQFTYDEIKQNKLYAHKISQKLPANGDNKNFTSEKMFPLLRHLFDQLDERLAFNIEVKYPQELEDGTNEAERCFKWIDRNEYADIILNELFNNCKLRGRCVVLTTFDPTLCQMLKMKQHKFPVLFLTNGITSKWTPYYDFRTKNTRISTNFALVNRLNGVVLHSEELFKDKQLIEISMSGKKMYQEQFLVYGWGDDLNQKENRELFKSFGFDAVIYDRINEPES